MPERIGTPTRAEQEEQHRMERLAAEKFEQPDEHDRPTRQSKGEGRHKSADGRVPPGGDHTEKPHHKRKGRKPRRSRICVCFLHNNPPPIQHPFCHEDARPAGQNGSIAASTSRFSASSSFTTRSHGPRTSMSVRKCNRFGRILRQTSNGTGFRGCPGSRHRLLLVPAATGFELVVS